MRPSDIGGVRLYDRAQSSAGLTRNRRYKSETYHSVLVGEMSMEQAAGWFDPPKDDPDDATARVKALYGSSRASR